MSDKSMSHLLHSPYWNVRYVIINYKASSSDISAKKFRQIALPELSLYVVELTIFTFACSYISCPMIPC